MFAFRARHLLQKNYAAELVKVQNLLKEKAKTAVDDRSAKAYRDALQQLDIVSQTFFTARLI